MTAHQMDAGSVVERVYRSDDMKVGWKECRKVEQMELKAAALKVLKKVVDLADPMDKLWVA